MAKFKVGDKVRIKEGLTCGGRYGNLYFPCGCSKYCGKEYTIIDIDNCGIYSLKGIDYYYFNDEMLEPVIEKPIHTTQVREAKRKAEIGEYIKLVDDCNGVFRKGQIYKVKSYFGRDETKEYSVGVKVVPIDDDYITGFFHSKYVVLENYNPPEITYTQSEVNALIKAERDRIYNEVTMVFKEVANE